MMPGRTLITVRHFLYGPSPGSQLDKVPRRPLLVSTTAHQGALPLFSLTQTDQGLTWLGSVDNANHVGSYFKPAPANCCTVSKRGLRLGMQHFLQLALSQC